MAFSDLKITAGDKVGKTVSELEDVVVGQASNLKARFDAMDDLQAERFNSLCDLLDSEIGTINTNITSAVEGLGWKLIGTVTGTGNVAISSDILNSAREFFVWLQVKVDNNWYSDSWIITPGRFSSATQTLCGGFHLSSTVNGGWRVQMRPTAAIINDCYIQGKNTLSNTTIVVYYR